MSIFGGVNNEVLERIKRLRLVRGWDQAELAVRARILQPKVSQIESGRLAPTDEQISGIATALGYSPSFLTAELRLNPTTRPWLRAYADASKREADARIAATTLAVEYVRSLSLQLLPNLIPAFRGALDDEEAIEEAATEVRHLAQIDHDAVVTNAMRAVERLGCLVLPLESELGRHLGMSVRADEIPVVSVAKTGVSGDRQRWTVAHELGHLTLHGNAPPPRDARESRRMEDEAHRFAGAFLCPEEMLHEALDNKPVTLNALAEVKAVWGVAIKALVHRCDTLGIIDSDHARSLYKQISSRKWSRDEPVYVSTESAQWLERSLLRKAEGDDLPGACKRLASDVGGNSDDLLSFADWTEGEDGQIVSLAKHRRN